MNQRQRLTFYCVLTGVMLVAIAMMIPALIAGARLPLITIGACLVALASLWFGYWQTGRQRRREER